MAYNTKNIIRDAAGAPAPQKWNQAGDTYVPFCGGVEIQNSFAVGAVTVGTSAVELKAGASALSARRKIIIRVIGSDAVYIGPASDVTTSTGFPVLPGEVMQIACDPLASIPVYAIAASNQTVRIMEIN